MNFKHDFSNSILTFTFQDGVIVEFNLAKCSQSIRNHLALHGAVQMVGTKISQGDSPESEYELAEDMIAYICEQYPEKKSTKNPHGLLIEALSRIKGHSKQVTIEKWNQLSPEKSKELDTHPTVKDQIAVIKAERAAERAQRYLDQNPDWDPSDLSDPNADKDKNPEKEYSHSIDLENYKAHFYINGQELELDLSSVKNVEALALYGAKQKICDSFSGIKNDSEKRIKAEKIIQNLYSGIWSSRGGNSQQEAGPSLLDKQLTDQLTEWMRWPKNATVLAVDQFDERDKAKLLNHPDTKRLLILYSRKLGMEDNPAQCGQGEIAEVLAEVPERIDSLLSAP